MTNKAIFFDRDGCLIVDKHYLKNPSQVEYFSDTFSALKILQNQGYKLFIVTNQSGIARGYFSLNDMHEVHQKIISDFSSHSIEITDIAFCPHSPEDQCLCRKPHPKMINDLVDKYAIDTSCSHMIGDKESDAQCGENAGIKGHLIFSDSPKFQSRFDSLTDFAHSLTI